MFCVATLTAFEVKFIVLLVGSQLGCLPKLTYKDKSLVALYYWLLDANCAKSSKFIQSFCLKLT